MSEKTLPQIVNDVFVLLDPLESEDRQKVVGSVLTLLGEVTKPLAGSGAAGSGTSGGSSDESPNEDVAFGAKAKRWMSQNQISSESLEEIFHCEDKQVEIIVSEVPGSGKKGKTHNCYLLAGIRSLLETDEAKFEDSSAVELCKHMGCHDSANHATNRNSLGNIVTGSKSNGFTLPAPGLRAGAELIKQMAAS